MLYEPFTLSVGDDLESTLTALSAVIADEALADEALASLEAQMLAADAQARRLGWAKPFFIACVLALPQESGKPMSQRALAGLLAERHGKGWSQPMLAHNLKAWNLAASTLGLPETSDFASGVTATINGEAPKFSEFLQRAMQTDPESRAKRAQAQATATKQRRASDKTVEQQVEQATEDLDGEIEALLARAAEVGAEVEVEDTPHGPHITSKNGWVEWDRLLLSFMSSVVALNHLPVTDLRPVEAEQMAQRVTQVIDGLTAVHERLLSADQPEA